MNQFSIDNLKTLIEINEDINSDYSNKDALLIRILKSAVRLVKSEFCSFVTYELGTQKTKIIASILNGEESTQEILLEKKSLALDTFIDGKSIFKNDIEVDPYYQSKLCNIFPFEIYSFLIVPIFYCKKKIGVIELFNKDRGFEYTENDVIKIEFLASIAGNSISCSDKFISQTNQIVSLKQNINFTSNSCNKFHEFIAKSPIIKDLMEIVKKAAITNSSVLLTGESGVGKELFAEQVFLNSKRAEMPFVRVNCASLSETLMESELFGHVKGAYTSADSSQKGRFEMADGGTIFLDEVGEIPIGLQAKLLRVIQDKQFERVGSSETISVDVRIIAATNRNLAEMVKNGTFREDLFFRLNVLPIRIPPLRARKEDIIPIANAFLQTYSIETGKTYKSFSQSACDALESYRWPGNIRELENAVARACIIGNPPVIQTSDLRLFVNDEFVDTNIPESNKTDEIVNKITVFDKSDRSLKAAQERFKRAYVINILDECGWNQTKASKIMGIQRTYVSRLINELNIRENR